MHSGAGGTILFQHFNRSLHNLFLIPLNASEISRNTTLRIENIYFDPVPVNERLDKVNSELEVFAQRIKPVGSTQEAMLRIEAHASVGAIIQKTFGQIETGIVSYARSIDLIGEVFSFYQFLNTREFGDGE